MLPSSRNIRPSTNYPRADPRLMTDNDRIRYEEIRRAGIPVPSPVSQAQLKVMFVEAKLLLGLKQSNPSAWRRQMQCLEEWIQPQVEPDSTNRELGESSLMATGSAFDNFRVAVPGRVEVDPTVQVRLPFRNLPPPEIRQLEEAPRRRPFYIHGGANRNENDVARPPNNAEPIHRQLQMAEPNVNPNPFRNVVYPIGNERQPEMEGIIELRRRAATRPPGSIVRNEKANHYEYVASHPLYIGEANNEHPRVVAQPIVIENPPARQVVLPPVNEPPQVIPLTVSQSDKDHQVISRDPRLRQLPSRETGEASYADKPSKSKRTSNADSQQPLKQARIS